MKKKSVGILLGVMFSTIVLSGCGGKEAAETANEEIWVDESEDIEDSSEEDGEENKDGNESENAEQTEEVISREKIAVFLPEESLDGNYLSAAFEEAGYETVIQYANDAELQAEQIQRELGGEYRAFVVAPVDVYGFTEQMTEVETAEIPVINYDDLIMDTAEVDYYMTFGGREIGQMIGMEIIEREDLKKSREEQLPKSIEFFMGSSDDTQALFVYNGILDVLQEYLDDGTLICKSGKVSFNDTGVLRWDDEHAGENFAGILSEYYEDNQIPDIICTGFDGAAISIQQVLEEYGVIPGNENWPMITGIGCEAEAVKAIAEGKMSFSIFADPRVMAQNCVELVELILEEKEIDKIDYEQYDNGVKIVGTYLCEAQLIDKDNYEVLIDNGYYTEEEVASEMTPDPTPVPTEIPVEVKDA